MELLIMATFVAMALPLKAIAYIVGNTGKTELVGSAGSAVPVNTSGVDGNFPTGTVTLQTTFAKFQMLNDATKARAFDMKVTVQSVVGSLDITGGKTGLMIAQTTNSQGLTDPGTLTILSDFGTTSGVTSVTLAFQFFNPDSDTLTPIAMQLTSFDFDFGQFIQVNSIDFNQAAFGSNLIASQPAPGQIRYQSQPAANATFSDAASAVSLTSVSATGFNVTLGKLSGGGNSLFMFEFRDPSINLSSELPPATAVPEPSTALLCSIMGFAFLRRKRRA